MRRRLGRSFGPEAIESEFSNQSLSRHPLENKILLNLIRSIAIVDKLA